MPDEETQDPKPNVTDTPQPVVTLGRMVLSAERAELSDVRPVFGALHYFDPDALKAALRGELLPSSAKVKP